MNEEEAQKRAEEYFELCNSKGWNRLLEEMEAVKQDLTLTILESDQPCLHMKGRYKGILQTLDTPLSAVREHFKDREQPQGQDSKET